MSARWANTLATGQLGLDTGDDRAARASTASGERRASPLPSIPFPTMKASKKNNAVANTKSVKLIVVGYPPRRTTVAQVKASVPRALPALSTEATTRTNKFSCFSGQISPRWYPQFDAAVPSSAATSTTTCST
uniref:Uncharacterized protein n=1 Tax=Leersia perrieri TaxID=77586 RepID=A0A0D9X295_9ORYZ